MNKKLIIFIILISLLIAGGIFWWQSQSKEAETYSEVFKNPIDPINYPKEHKRVYEKAQKIVDFPVIYPIEMPEGYGLVKVECDRDILSKEKGACIFTYRKGEKQIRVIEGVADIGFVEDLGEIELKNGEKGWLWKRAHKLGISLPSESSSYNYFLTGENLSKEELIQIANMFFSESK